MPAMDTSMDTVLEYLESISDMDNLSNNLENSQQLIEDLDIVTDWINDLLDLRVTFFFIFAIRSLLIPNIQGIICDYSKSFKRTKYDVP